MGSPYVWGLGNCLPLRRRCSSLIASGPWVSKQEVAQLGLLFLAASLPGIPPSDNEAAVPQRVRPHPTEDSGAGDRMCNGPEGTLGSTAELQHGPLHLCKTRLELIKQESHERERGVRSAELAMCHVIG